MTELSVVIPVYHCAGCLGALHERLTARLLAVTPDYEIIRVDDSTDGAWEILSDFVIATNHINTVRECVQVAFDEAGIADWERYIRLDPAFLRPAEVDPLIGDRTKAKQQLGWEPQTTFEELIRLMTRSDLALLSR